MEQSEERYGDKYRIIKSQHHELTIARADPEVIGGDDGGLGTGVYGTGRAFTVHFSQVRGLHVPVPLRLLQAQC